MKTNNGVSPCSQTSHREFDTTVGQRPPVFDNRYITGLRSLTDDLAGLAASDVDRQPEYLRLLHAGHPVSQVARTNEHVAPPNSKTMIVSLGTWIEERLNAVLPASHIGQQH
jgi:hypothetical protein